MPVYFIDKTCYYCNSTAIPRSLDPIYIITYYIKWVKTTWTNSINLMYKSDMVKQIWPKCPSSNRIFSNDFIFSFAQADPNSLWIEDSINFYAHIITCQFSCSYITHLILCRSCRRKIGNWSVTRSVRNSSETNEWRSPSKLGTTKQLKINNSNDWNIYSQIFPFFFFF